jgi:hypothetical protein
MYHVLHVNKSNLENWKQRTTEMKTIVIWGIFDKFVIYIKSRHTISYADIIPKHHFMDESVNDTSLSQTDGWTYISSGQFMSMDIQHMVIPVQ